MDGKTLQSATQERAEGLPAVTHEHPFGPDWEVIEVRGKVFMLMTEVPGQPVVILNAAPSDARSLREAYADITPGYHMNKRHWITLAPGDSIDKALVEDLVTDSYRLVVGKLPKALRPVDPESFGVRASDRRRAKASIGEELDTWAHRAPTPRTTEGSVRTTPPGRTSQPALMCAAAWWMGLLPPVAVLLDGSAEGAPARPTRPSLPLDPRHRQT